MNAMTYQLIQLDDPMQNVSCPYCQQHIIDWQQEQYIQPCQHTLFIAMDLGFEFIADHFEAKMSRTVDIIHEDPEMNIFQEITATDWPDLIVYKADLGVEGLYRYIGLSQVV
jgi:hypothetical protein